MRLKNKNQFCYKYYKPDLELLIEIDIKKWRYN